MLQSSMDRSPSHPRHVRAAQVVEFVGMQARAQGQSEAHIATLCQEAIHLFSTGKLQPVMDPDTGDGADITVLA